MAAEENLRPNVVCLASYFKGNDFLRECKAQGCRVFLVTREKTLGEDWARESLEDIIVLPDKTTPEIFIRAVEELARRVRVDRVVALEEYDVVTAALAREHLCLPGMSGSTARLFRDKLAMRARASGSGIRVPDFVSAINYQAVGEYMKRVPAPWVLKPRSDVSAVGIRKLHHPEEVWRAMEELDRGERQDERSPYYLLERFVPGDVYHVDSMVDGWQVRFAGANKYGRPPMEVAHQGGVFISHTVMHDSEEEKELFNLNRRLIEALGLERGATHAEFIRGAEDGEFYFLEIAARVGGAYIAEVLEAATGLNLWREWAKVEVAGGDGSYDPRPTHKEYGGITLTLARQEWPDTSAYTDPEIVFRPSKRHHVCLVVRSPGYDRVQELLARYARRFTEDFAAVLPPLEKPR